MTGRTILPDKETTWADPEDVAHRINREAGLLRFVDAEGYP